MKKLLLSLSVAGCLLFVSCEKNEELIPSKQVIQADKGIMCRGCGDWDIIGTQSTDAGTSSTDTLSNTSKSAKPPKNNK